MVVSNGNFYNVSSDLSVQNSLPRDANGELFEASNSTGQSYIILDKISGMTMAGVSSQQINFQVFSDLLFAYQPDVALPYG